MTSAETSTSQDQRGPGRSEALPEMSLLEHLTELRRRLIVSIAAVAIGAIIAWGFSDEIFALLTAPVRAQLPPDDNRLAFLTLTSAFVVYLKVSLVAGIFAASPVLSYQAWMFIAPGLYRRERRHAIPVVLASALCFILGGLFGYTVLFPIMAQFFLNLGSEFRALLTIDSLFGFLLRTLLGCALIFEWPVVVLFLARFGLLTARGMWRNMRYAVLAIFIIAAVVTPTPDMATQTILAVPMLLLYLVGIVIAWAVQRRDQEPA